MDAISESFLLGLCSAERKCGLFWSGMFVLDMQQHWRVSQVQRRISTDGKPDQCRSHLTRGKGWFDWNHPHTDSGDRPPRGAESGKCRKRCTNQCLDFSSSFLHRLTQRDMMPLLFPCLPANVGLCLEQLYEKKSSLKPLFLV